MTLQKTQNRDSVDKIIVALLHNDVIAQNDLPKLTGLSRVTISKEIKILEAHRYITFVRKRTDDTRGRPGNSWKLSFRGMLLLIGVLNRRAEELAYVINKFADKWVIFKEWDYISKNKLVETYVMNKIFGYINREGVNLLLYEKPFFPDINPWHEDKLSERERLQYESDEEDKGILLREILGLHELFFDKDDPIHGGWWNVLNVMSYLLKNGTFKALYTREINLLKTKFKYLNLVSEIMDTPQKSKEISDKLFYLQLEDHDQYVLGEKN